MTGSHQRLCAGTNRFDQPCGNPPAQDSDFCGKCKGPKSLPSPPDPPTPLGAPQTSQASDDPWTPAGSLNDRLSRIAVDNPQLGELARVATELAAASRSQTTRDTYEIHWRTFTKFCDLVGLSATVPVPPETVVLYLAYLARFGRKNPITGERDNDPDLAPLKHGYLRQAISAISRRHELAGFPTPTSDPAVGAVLVGYGKTHGTRHNGSDPLHGHQIRTICAHIAATPNTTKRDLALVVLIAGGHITPGQAARLNSEHVLWATGHPEHAAVIAVQRRRSATGLDLISLPDSLPIAICPTAALRALDHHQRGPVFRRPDGARLTRQAIVKILTKAIGTPATTSTLAGLTTRDIADASESLRTPAWSDIRARAVLVFLYGATLRGGELAALRWDDTRISPNGVEVTVRRAKNDPHGKGHTIGAPRKSDPIHCPAAIFDELHATYAAVLGRDPHPHEPLIAKLDTTTDGLLPISRERISEIVTTRAAAAGDKGRYTSHSPRAGSATDMLDNGAPMAQVIKHGRWQTEQSVHAYYRRTQIWGNLNPAQQLPDSAS